MRKLNKIPAVVLALVLALSLAACGDSFESAMVRALREMQDVESVHADMTLEMAFDFTAEGAEKMSVPISVAMGMDTDGTLTSGTVDVNFLGMLASALYIVENKGEACDLYMSIDGGESWQSQLDISAEDLQSVDDGVGVNGDLGGMLDMYLELSSGFGEAVYETLDGVDCVRYDGTFPGANLTEALSYSGGAVFAGGIHEGTELPAAPISIWLEQDSGLPKRISVDMTDAMGQYMTEMFSDVAADGSTLSITTVTVTVDMSDYNAASPMSPPEM